MHVIQHVQIYLREELRQLFGSGTDKPRVRVGEDP